MDKEDPYKRREESLFTTNRRLLFSAIFFFACIAVWYSNKSGSNSPDSSDNTEFSPENDRSVVSKNCVSEQGNRRRQELRELLAMQAVAKKLTTRLSTGDDERTEDEQMAEMTNTPEQILWRSTWRDEGQDDDWTRQMDMLLKDKARSLLAGEIDVRHLSCRETVCRMFLQFEDKIDAESFTYSQRDTNFQYEYQLLNPDADDGDGDGKDKKYNYEVLVKRERPANLTTRTQSRKSGETDTSFDDHS